MSDKVFFICSCAKRHHRFVSLFLSVLLDNRFGKMSQQRNFPTLWINILGLCGRTTRTKNTTTRNTHKKRTPLPQVSNTTTMLAGRSCHPRAHHELEGSSEVLN